MTLNIKKIVKLKQVKVFVITKEYLMTKKRHTKIILSCEASKVDFHEYKAMKNNFNIIRILYSPENITQILEFAREVKKQKKQHQLPPVMIDASYKPRGIVDKIKKNIEINSGDSLQIGLAEEKNVIKIISSEWNNLFQKDTKVYFGYGDITTVVNKIENSKVTLTVLQGGELYSGMEIHVPTTYKPPSIFDLSFVDIRPFLQLEVDYVIIPGIPSKNSRPAL